MNKLEKKTQGVDKKGEMIANHESIETIRKAQYSSLMAIGLFMYADNESIFLAQKIASNIISRMNEPLRVIQEINECSKFMETEMEIHAKIVLAETIWHIQDIIGQGDVFLTSLKERK